MDASDTQMSVQGESDLIVYSVIYSSLNTSIYGALHVFLLKRPVCLHRILGWFTAVSHVLYLMVSC
ncbi:hypothetical protein F5Y18DRAFT_371797 [Xylariaceae sp. FL1019]|nr:hypothetical protein F5Y18DRAFT_371797 [Xylariaceae sp. FL1019]